MKLFISHSSSNNASALAVEQWLVDSGWQSYFLDISENTGLIAGERWQQALRDASYKCEAVIFLISSEWLASPWCLSEFLLAKQLGKQIFGLMIEELDINAIPREMTAEWQLCDLVNGEDLVEFKVSRDPFVKETLVKFAAAGLKSLRQGLDSSGLGAESFQWPPPNDPKRSPYPGLRPLLEEDAAVFFGREAMILRCMDTIRKMQDQGNANSLVILGASGSGKSSFMRAGVIPRLKRNDQRYLCLAPVRPGRNVFSSEEGWFTCLQRLCEQLELSINFGEIKRIGKDADEVALLIRKAATRWLGTNNSDGPQHLTIVLPIDQAEELYFKEGGDVSDPFLAIINNLQTRQMVDEKNAISIALLTIWTIRTDMFELMQADTHFDPDQRQILDLPSMDATQYQSVIIGPAERSTAAGIPLKIEATLTEKLLQDTSGSDALPLLAFTLEALYRDFGTDGELLLSEYEALGYIQGSISAAIDSALEYPDEQPAIPQSRKEQLALLKQAFIPFLAEVEEQSGEARRRVAALAELPEESLPIIERFVNKHLLVKDVISSPENTFANDHGTQASIEVAHEALLRHWPQLIEWLTAEKESYTTLASIIRAAESWSGEKSSDEWLDHSGERLQNAEKLLTRPDFAKRAGEKGANYIAACRRLANETEEKQQRQLEQTARDQQIKAERQRRIEIQQRRFAIFLGVFVAATLGFLIWIVRSQIDFYETQSRVLAAEANGFLDENSNGLALRHALAASQMQFITPATRESVLSLNRTAFSTVLTNKIQNGTGGSRLAISSDGETVAIADTADTLSVWNRPQEKLLLEWKLTADISDLALSHDDRFLISTSFDNTARVWDLNQDQNQSAQELPHGANPVHAEFSANDNFILTVTDSDIAYVWDARTFLPIHVLTLDGLGTYGRYSPDGSQFVTTDRSGSAILWDTATGQRITAFKHETEVIYADFSADSSMLLSVDSGNETRVWDLDSYQLKTILTAASEEFFIAANFSSDGRFIVTSGNATRIWDSNIGAELFRFDESLTVTKAFFFNDDHNVFTNSLDGTSSILDSATGKRVIAVPNDARFDGVVDAAISPQSHVITNIRLSGSTKFFSSNSGVVPQVYAHSRGINDVDFSADKQQLVTASDDGSAVLWNLTTGKTEQTLLQQQDPVTLVAYIGDNNTVAAVVDRFVILWDTDNRREIGRIELNSSVQVFDYSPSADLIMTISGTSTVSLWDRQSLQLVKTIEVPRHDSDNAMFSEFGQYLLFATEGKFEIWDARAEVRLASIPDDGYYYLSWSSDGQMLIAAYSTNVKIYNALSGELLEELPMDQNSFYVNLSPDNSRLLVDHSLANYVEVWDINSRQRLFTLQNSGLLVKAQFSNDNGRILTTSDEGTAMIWEGETGQLLATLQHGDFISTASFAGGSHVITAGADGLVKRWDISWLTETSLEKLTQKTCDHFGPSVTTITPEDIEITPLLSAFSGQDLCRDYR